MPSWRPASYYFTSTFITGAVLKTGVCNHIPNSTSTFSIVKPSVHSIHTNPGISAPSSNFLVLHASACSATAALVLSFMRSGLLWAWITKPVSLQPCRRVGRHRGGTAGVMSESYWDQMFWAVWVLGCDRSWTPLAAGPKRVFN